MIHGVYCPECHGRWPARCGRCGGWGWVRLPDEPTSPREGNVTMHEQHRCAICGHRVTITAGRVEHADRDDWTLADHQAEKERTP